MAHRMPQCAKNANELLQELERDQELDVLRNYLTEFRLFPRNRDPATAPIRYEELKELVKHWKLHRQRNFWRNHTKKEDLVKTLHKHINSKLVAEQRTRTEDGALGLKSETPQPVPPSQAKKVKLPKGRHSIVVEEDGKKKCQLGNYRGDLFGQRGDYEGGMIYLSRLGRRDEDQPKNKDDEIEQESKTVDQTTQEDEEEEGSGNVSLASAASREKDLKRRCACSLYQLTIDVGNEKSIIADGCMPAIVRLSMFDDMETKRYCAGAIVNIACDISLCPSMIEDGVLTALSELSKAQHDEIRQNASVALCRMSYDRQGQLRLVQEGSVSAMLGMINANDYVTQEACVKALINIASFSGSAVMESVVHILVAIANSEPVDEQENRDRTAFVARAIRNLSLLTGARVKVLDDGLLEAVVKLIKHDLDEELKEEIAIALRNFSGVHANFEEMAEKSVLEAIRILLRSPNEKVKEMCAIALSNLSCDDESLKIIVANEMIAELVEVGSVNNPVILESVAQAISNMAANPASQPLLAKDGAVRLLVQYLKDGNVVTKQFAVIALCNLMVHPQTRNDVIQHSIVPCLVSLSKSDNVKICEICALALYNLSCDESLLELINNKEAVEALVILCKTISTTRSTPSVELSVTQEYCLGSLYNMSFDSRCRQALTSGKVIPLFLDLFRNAQKRSERHRQQCAAVVCNLSFDESCRAAIIQDQGIDLIKRLLISTQKETLLCCSTALCNLAIEAEDSNMLPMLIQLAGTQHSDITLSCAIACSKLASHEKFRADLAENEELAPALTVMMRSGREEIQISAAVALCNLASERGKRSRIWKQGTIPDFIVNSLLRVNSDSTKEVCARALFNLLTHESIRSSMINEGVLYALVKLARLESLEIRELCVIAIYNLSCASTSMIKTLMEMKIVQVLTKMCESEYSTLPIRRMLSASLNNVTQVKGNETHVVEGGGLTAIRILSSNGDDYSLRQCAAALCAISFDSASCPALVSEEMLEVLTQMITSTDPIRSALGLNVVCNLTCHPELHSKVVGGDIIPHVLTILSSSEDQSIAMVCPKIICNLIYAPALRLKILEQGLIQSLHTLLHKNGSSDATIPQVCARLVSTLTEDEALVKRLNEYRSSRILSLCSNAADAKTAEGEETIEKCLIGACHLSRDRDTGQTLVQDGAIDIIANAIAKAVASGDLENNSFIQIGYRCSVLARNLSSSPGACEGLSGDSRIVDLLGTLSRVQDRDTCRNTAITLYNLILSSKNLRDLADAGVVPVLLDLSQMGHIEVRQVCAVAVAHLNSELEGDESTHKVEGGLVSTLTSMLDMDQSTVQKVERAASAFAHRIPVDERQWIFLPGVTVALTEATDPVNWDTRLRSLSDSQYEPVEPRTYLEYLHSISAEATASLKDEALGNYKVMKVSDRKTKVAKRILLKRRSTKEILDELSSAEVGTKTPDPTEDDDAETRSASPTFTSDRQKAESGKRGRKSMTHRKSVSKADSRANRSSSGQSLPKLYSSHT